MGYLELDMELSGEVKAIQKEARKFAMDVMRPVGIELDKLQDPTDVYAKDSVLWDVIKKHREMNLHQLSISKELGGMAEDVDPKTGAIIYHEMGYGDAGLAISLGVSSNPFRMKPSLSMSKMSGASALVIKLGKTRLYWISTWKP